MDIASIIDFSRPIAFGDEYLPSEDRLIQGNPAQRVSKGYSSNCGQLSTGIWEGAAGQWRVNFKSHEYCEILAGVSVLRDLSGTQKTVGKGDRFIVPAGFTGTWEVLETCRKLYVVFKPL